MMASYKIEWKQSAKRELKKIEKGIIVKIIESVQSLSQNPYPRSSKKLRGSETSYRIRVGDYRIVYTIHASVLTVEIIRVGHRKEIYRRFF